MRDEGNGLTRYTRRGTSVRSRLGTIQTKVIYVIGVDFKNRGAHLMLHAVQEWAERLGLKVAVKWRVGTYVRRRKQGVVTVARYDGSRFDFLGAMTAALGNALPARVRRALGVASDRDVVGVLDANGFAYSDRWSVSYPQRMVRLVREWRQRGAKFVLLPQAFGPFEHVMVKHGMEELLELAELVMVRDDRSLRFLRELCAVDGGNERLLRSPDMTCCVRGRTPPYGDLFRGRACVIPNVRMARHALALGEYVSLLADAIRILERAGLRPFILLHESEEDRVVALKLQAQTKRPDGAVLQIVDEANPEFLKGLIGCCYLVVGSRYHGLLNALDQGVPALGTGWSHKYDCLFDEYGHPEWLFGSGDVERFEALVRELLDAEHYNLIVQELRVQGAKSRERMAENWARVEDVLGLKSTVNGRTSESLS